jgi:hypothetical protein
VGADAYRRNERIAEKALAARIDSRVPFVCECADPDCVEFVLLDPREYKPTRERAGGYLTVAGHLPPSPT